MTTASTIMTRRWCRWCAALALAGVIGCSRQAVSDKPLSAAELAVFAAPEQLSAWQEPGSWPQFGHDPLHTGRTTVELGTKDLELAWKFKGSKQTLTYEKGYCVWSSPIAATINGRPMVFLGGYDHALYAVDARTGKQVWRFVVGDPIFASPALGHADGKPAVFVAATDRTIYAVDAATGTKIWSKETRAWTFTSEHSHMAAPTVVQADGKELLFLGIWNGDRSTTNNVQKGELLCVNPDDGAVIWQKEIDATAPTAPAVARIDGALTVFAAVDCGIVRAFDGLTGETRWKFHLDSDTRASVTLGAPDGLPMVFVGTRFNALYALDARTGGKWWRYQMDNWIDTTPTLLGPTDDLRVVVGDYRVNFHAVDARSGRNVWRMAAKNWAHVSTVTARLDGEPVVIAASWDQNVYLLTGAEGGKLWSYETGPLIWEYVEMGDAQWASPIVAAVDGVAHVFYPALDGILYAFRGRKVDAATTAPASAIVRSASQP